MPVEIVQKWSVRILSKKMGMTEVEDHLLSYIINITCRVKILCAFQNKKKKLHASSSAEPSSGESCDISGSSRNS